MKKAALARLAARGTVGDAAREIGVNRSTLYEWRDSDSVFAAAWQDISESVTDDLERTAIEFAMDGYTETKTVTESNGDVRVEEHHKRDPNTLKFMLGARRRHTYGAKTEIEHSGTVTSKRIVWGEKPEPKTEPEGELEE